MKYKRRRAKVSKYISYTEDKSRKKVYKKLSFKKQSALAAGLMLACFCITRLNIVNCEFVKNIFTQSSGFVLENSEFLNVAGDYIAEFCFGYLKGESPEPSRVHAETTKEKETPVSANPQKTLPAIESSGEKDPQTEMQQVFAPFFPCKGEITSEFGERVHPITAEVTFHNGIDIALSEGDEIAACFDGKVIKSEFNEYSGNYIVIQHMDDYTSSYAHMSKLLVSVGTSVKQGDIIGLAGSTGSATGPHLHFEIRQGGTPLDPAKMTEE